ncbi:MAG TPA: acyl-CoA dehydrogenase family protein [Polyangiaceae bacterium]|nr:acyl-CoA dehydrogenase family protein [Polyangiaceae bacterium]
MSNAPEATQQTALETAERLARAFALTAVERDRLGGTAKRERDELRASGLLRLTIPRELGGLGGSLGQALQLVRVFARVDPSIAHLFGFHHLLLATVRLFGHREQWERSYRESAERPLFWGNALNPLDTGTRLQLDAEGRLSLRGRKSFCSGATDSDRLLISAHRATDERLVIGVVPSSRPGIRYLADWDNIGQRQTDSGSVEFDDVAIEESELLLSPGPLSSPFAALRPCIAQLSLVNVYLGIAEGALEAAREYTQNQRRPWLNSGVEHAARDPYVLHHYGEMWVSLEATRLLADEAGRALDAAFARGEALASEARGEVALKVAAAKAQSTRASLDVTARIFDVMGARSTTRRAGMDRFFRNTRTHTLHDPVDYKFKELGDWALNREYPKPSFYS